MKNNSKLNDSINNIQNELIKKCDMSKKLFPNLESQIEISKNNINYIIKSLIDTNNEIDNLIKINSINKIKYLCNLGMKNLENIYNNNLNKNDEEQNKKFYSLYNELKIIFKEPTTTFEETQAKLIKIEALTKEIEKFQNELNNKILYKKLQFRLEK